MATLERSSDAPGLLTRLQNIKIGKDPGLQVKRKDLVRILQNLTTLISNGVSIAQSLDTVRSDPEFRKYKGLLRQLSETVKGGGKLSAGMKKFPATFPQLLVHQIQIGERGGTIQSTLARIVEQLENGSQMKSFIIKKISYPAVLVVAGVGAVTFMMLCVIPTFQKMYEDNGAALPWITELMIAISRFVVGYGSGLAAILLAGSVAALIALRTPASRLWIDANSIRIPLLGKWLSNMAILQFVETLGNLLQSGFTLVDALPAASRSVSNRHLREKLLGLHKALRGGEKFSSALEREKDLFPPVVKQLVLVGERTGRLSEVTDKIRVHLRDDVQKKTAAMLGAIEPILTVCLAVAIGGILLAVYLPMFDMIGKSKS